MFPVSNRVPRKSFKKVLTEGKKISSDLFLLRVLPNNVEKSRFAVVITKKIANLSTERHKIKRIFVHAMKENLDKYSYSDYIFFPNQKITTATFRTISKEIRNVL